MADIYTHGDFDGIVSAALVGHCVNVRRTLFASPKTILERPVTQDDIVCDLPYPHRKIALWFDHHEGNIETVTRMGLAGEIDGRFEIAPSAVQVVYDHFKSDCAFPSFIEDTVKWSNIVDSMDYDSVEAWMEPVPAHRINRALYLPGESFPDAQKFMRLLVRTAAKYPLDVIAESDDVEERYRIAAQHEAEAIDLIRRVGTRVGAGGEIVLLDFSEDRFAPRFSKNVAYTIHPDAKGILQLSPGFKDRKRANEIRVSLSVNPFGKEKPTNDAAAILETLELGSGHAGAAGGAIRGDSKEQLTARKKETVDRIAALWAEQG